jgi:type II secretory pathway pseudopilin PulG
MSRQAGLTILELMIILAIIAVLITMAIPNLLGSQIDTRETSALGNVRAVVGAQLMFAARKEADQNHNGIGEFGTFGELSGSIAVRAANGGTRYMDPGTINPSFRMISPIGEMFRSGYYFRMYLPDDAGDGLTELAGGGADPNVNADLAESTWCVYAWPQKFGTTGRRTYFVNQEGDVLYTVHPAYEGAGAPITAGAALQQPGSAANMRGPLAVGGVGRDGNTWYPATK